MVQLFLMSHSLLTFKTLCVPAHLNARLSARCVSQSPPQLSSQGFRAFAVLTFWLLFEHTLMLFCLFKNILPGVSPSKNVLLYISFPGLDSRVENFFLPHLTKHTWFQEFTPLQCICVYVSLSLRIISSGPFSIIFLFPKHLTQCQFT